MPKGLSFLMWLVCAIAFVYLAYMGRAAYERKRVLEIIHEVIAPECLQEFK